MKSEIVVTFLDNMEIDIHGDGTKAKVILDNVLRLSYKIPSMIEVMFKIISEEGTIVESREFYVHDGYVYESVSLDKALKVFKNMQELLDD